MQKITSTLIFVLFVFFYRRASVTQSVALNTMKTSDMGIILLFFIIILLVTIIMTIYNIILVVVVMKKIARINSLIVQLHMKETW